jgi:hypothetical protein
MVVQELLRRTRDAGVSLEPTDHGTLRLSGHRPPPDLLAELTCHKAGLLVILRSPAIGTDLIPRAGADDPRYAGVDLVARGRDASMLHIGIARLSLTPEELSTQMNSTAERIARELVVAGLEELGHWATDVVYAYGDVPDLPEPVQVAAYHAWSSALELSASAAEDEQPPTAAA